MAILKSHSFFSILRFNFLSSFRFQIGHRDRATYGGKWIHHSSTVVDVSELGCDELVDDEKTKEKDTALRLALTQLASEFSKESMLSLSRFFRCRRAPVISTGSLKLDLALGIGGLPKGRMVEIYGKEASGKTTLAFHIIKEAQKLGGYCAYFDAENAMDPSLAESVGINTRDLLISCPDSAENILSSVDTLVKSGALDVIVVDSVAALVPQCEIDVVFRGNERDMQSQVMTKALRKIHYSLCHSKSLVIFLNQVRYDVKSSKGFGQADEVTCGGNALRFYAAVRLRISRKGLLKTKDKITGLGICVQVVKNKLAAALKKAELEIRFGKGICRASEVLELALEHGLALREGNSYFLEGEVFDNEQALKNYLSKNEASLDKVSMDLRSLLFERKS